MSYKRLTKEKSTSENTKIVYNENGFALMSKELVDMLLQDHNRLWELENKIENGTLIEFDITDKDILEDYAHRMFDSWNDITGAIHNGCSWYGEVLSVIDDIVGMVYGITTRQAKLKEIKE